jgi:hypothetical protein
MRQDVTFLLDSAVFPGIVCQIVPEKALKWEIKGRRKLLNPQISIFKPMEALKKFLSPFLTQMTP